MKKLITTVSILLATLSTPSFASDDIFVLINPYVVPSGKLDEAISMRGKDAVSSKNSLVTSPLYYTSQLMVVRNID